VLQGMERTALMEVYAQLVAEDAVRLELAVTYGPAIERDRHEFEQRKARSTLATMSKQRSTLLK